MQSTTVSRRGFVAGAVGYTESVKYANPGAELRLKASERRALGIRRARVGAASPWVGP